MCLNILYLELYALVKSFSFKGFLSAVKSLLNNQKVGSTEPLNILIFWLVQDFATKSIKQNGIPMSNSLYQVIKKMIFYAKIKVTEKLLKTVLPRG